MNEIEFELNSEVYSKKAIEISKSDFSEVCNIEILNKNFLLRIYSDLENLEKLKSEFINYVLAIQKDIGFKNPNKKCEIISEKKIIKNIKEGYQLNFFRYKKIQEEFLITTDSGNWSFIPTKELNLIKKNSIKKNSKLYNKLEESRIILTKKNFSKEVEFYKSKKSFLFQGPSLHIIILTLACNLKCSYCHASAKSKNQKEYDLSKENAKKIVDIIFESPSKNIDIEFQGGESLLNFNVLKYIVNYARAKNKIIKKNLNFSIVSNLVAMDDKKLDFLISEKVSICTSLDGPEFLHNINRQEHAKTVKWIYKIQKKYSEKGINKNNLNALLTVTKESLNYPIEIIDEYLKLGFNEIFLRQMNLLGDALKKDPSTYYKPQDFILFWEKSLEYIYKLNKKGIKFKDRKTEILLKKIFDSIDPNFTELRNPCGAVLAQITYNYDGKIYSCDEGRMVSEDLFCIGDVNNSYIELTTNPTACSIISSSINDLHHCENCVYKPFCGLCPVINYSENNSTITNIVSSNWCKLHKGQFDTIFSLIKNNKKMINEFRKNLN